MVALLQPDEQRKQGGQEEVEEILWYVIEWVHDLPMSTIFFKNLLSCNFPSRYSSEKSTFSSALT